ncbi:Hypothetical protein I595_1930 [Croceitalea dokdonensis DOKDO 023]|uniref:Uncharacterized protein n=1 Tax=Croceitalea dokdonensis DOKDO 023 TaxID=1300341 RepID=A0A0P7AKA5_9FLAO|nr:hypothetical protein [Croceitalea dokdonensis]KPM32280.1 Hypothetical protein I595_1930 [Croceitalea dokdonensis DOKDO 023]
MDLINYTISICLFAFMALATYDGFILHIWKYKLYQQPESIFEHKTHTVRAILFPLIVWSLLIQTDKIFFFIGLALTAMDLVVLTVDAYSEKDSRTIMGGLPRKEYILHLFANGFHFAIIALALVLKLSIVGTTLVYLPVQLDQDAFSTVLLAFMAKNAIPGAVVLAMVHVALLFTLPRNLWEVHRTKIRCC